MTILIKDILLFVLCVLAVWRLSSLVSDEDGPMKIFHRIREFALNKSDKSKLIDSLYDGLICRWCNSIWFSALFSLFISHGVLEWILFTLSMSALSILFDKEILKNG